jgi:hypothetical protein
MLLRIRAAGKDGEGAVDLLGEHHASEFVGIGHGTEGDSLLDALAECVGETVSVAANEDDFAGAAIALFTEPAGEGVRVVDLSGGVEEKSGGGAIGIELLDGGASVADFGDFDGAGTADAFEIVREDGSELGVTGFAEHEEADFHGGSLAWERGRK